jgi:hypothetical protein
MPRVRDLLHADRIYKLMDSGLTLPQAVRLDDKSAKLLIEAWDIAMDGQCDGDCDTIVVQL